MKVFKHDDTPTWREIEVTGKPLKHALTSVEYEEAYSKWVPKDDISFDKLLDIILPHCGMGSTWIDTGNIIVQFQEIFNQIKNGLDRKRTLNLFLKEVSHYQLNTISRKQQKEGKDYGYYKNHEQKVKGNKKAAIKVYESLIYEGSHEGTKTTQLANLLIEYVNQCDKILDSEEKIFEPLEIKDYKLFPKVSKEPLRECLERIIKEFDITVDSYLFNIAIESIKS